jgi:hypothetical protein
MCRSLEADAAPKIDAFVDWGLVVRAYGNHRQQCRPSLSKEMDQAWAGGGAYILPRHTPRCVKMVGIRNAQSKLDPGFQVLAAVDD